MNIKLLPLRILCLGLLLLGVTSGVPAQNIYRCPHGSGFEYTDQPCAGSKGEMLHKASDQEIIDSYIRLGQLDTAKQYAASRNLNDLYQQRLEAHIQNQEQRDQAAANEAAQREVEQQAQALADQKAHLQDQNELLREQNEQYRDELSQPPPEYPPVYQEGYLGGAPGWGGGAYRPDRPRPKPTPPIFHPCTQLAGGRVQC